MSKVNRLPELDSLRGIAALAVCIFHFSMANDSRLFPLKYFQYGATGVDLFFTISGFVIFMSIDKAKSIKSFWLSRFIRLFPAYWLSIIIALLTYWFFDQNVLVHVKNLAFSIGNLLMLQPLFKSGYLVHAYWTLYVELCFYWFIALVKLAKLESKIEYVLWAGLCVVASLNLVYWGGYRDNSYERFFIITRAIMPLLSYFGFFSNGIVFYKIYTHGINLNKIFLLIFGFSLTFIIHTTSGLFNLFFGTIERVICVAVIDGLFLLVALKKADFLRSKFLYFLGAISYALYLIHESFGTSLKAALVTRWRILPTVASITGIATSIALATLITYFFERPISTTFKTKSISSALLSKCKGR